MSGSKAWLLSTESAPGCLTSCLGIYWFLVQRHESCSSQALLVLHSKSVSLRQIQPICLCRVLERPLRIQRWASSVASSWHSSGHLVRAHWLLNSPNLGHSPFSTLSPCYHLPSLDHCLVTSSVLILFTSRLPLLQFLLSPVVRVIFQKRKSDQIISPLNTCKASQ